MKRRDVIEEDHNMEEEDIYTEDGVSCCSDDDEISSWEEGFMIGYLSG